MSILKGKTAPHWRRVGSDEQEAIYEALASRCCHLVIEARAGSGKSSACRQAQHRMIDADPSLAIRYAVFNKRNADEFKADCAAGVEVGTLHSFGLRAIARSIGSRVEMKKTTVILDGWPDGRAASRKIRRSIIQLVGHGKGQNLQPGAGESELRRSLAWLAGRFCVDLHGRPEFVLTLAARTLAESARRTDIVDYDDMVWLPAVIGLSFPPLDALFVDEAQDLNPAQHALVEAACPDGRLVAVGDTHQSIYAFRGADAYSMDRLRDRLGSTPRGMREMPLTITWRCPASHVEQARRLVPDIRARPGAPEGVFRSVGEPSLAGMASPGDMVVCHANSPLVGLALRLVAIRKPVVVRGRAVGAQLKDILWSDHVGGAKTVAAQLAGVCRWEAFQLNAIAEEEGAESIRESIIDRAGSLRAVLVTCDSPGDCERRIDELFVEDDEAEPGKGAVICSTIHRAKGLEAERVFFLDRMRPLDEESDDHESRQWRNLRYVALTRSKHTLFVTSKDAPIAECGEGEV